MEQLAQLHFKEACNCAGAILKSFGSYLQSVATLLPSQLVQIGSSKYFVVT
jgi:hypothetical protein